MRENQTLIDDIMSLGGSMLGNLLGARHEVRAQMGQRMDTLSKRLNLVSRDEFDSAFAMLAKARAMQEDLHERLSVIEARMNLSSSATGKKTVNHRLRSVKKRSRHKKRV